jgi:hypothetical protein
VLAADAFGAGPRATAVFVDQFDAGYFPSRRSPNRIIGQKDEIGFVLTQGTKIVNLRRDSGRRSERNVRAPNIGRAPNDPASFDPK